MDADVCSGCDLKYFEAISKFYKNNEAALDFLRIHGVLPNSVTCPHCNKLCNYRSDKHQWRCVSTFSIPKTKKRKYCNFVVLDYKGSFLSGTNLDPWKIVLFIFSFCDHTWNHKTVIEILCISSKTSVDWRSFCSKVTDSWFSNQKAIGGVGVEVEIDETLIVRRKYERGRVLNQVWLFGGVERISKKRFVIALTGDVGEKRDKATLIPLIQKYILKGSLIYSDSWGAYTGLDDLRYKHYKINHSENFVDPTKPSIHTQNIERLWLDIKQWIRRPGIWSKYLYQYLARYLFIRSQDNSVVHQFLQEAARLYTPGGEAVHPAMADLDLHESSDSE